MRGAAGSMQVRAMSFASTVSAKLDHHAREILLGAGISLALRVLGAGLGFGFNVVLARMVGAEGTGIYFIGLSVVSVVSIFGRLGLDSVALRRIAIHHDASGNPAGIATRVVKLGMLASLIASILVFGLAPLLADFVFSKPELSWPLRWMALSIVPLTLMTLYAEMLKGLKRIFYSQLVQVVLTPAISVLCLLASGQHEVMAAIWSYLAASIGAALAAFVIWQILVPRAAERVVVSTQNLLDESMPLMWVNALIAVNAWTDTFVLGLFRPAAEVGVYSVAARTAMLTGFVLIAVNNVIGPKFAALHGRGDTNGLARLAVQSARLTLLAAAPILLAFALMPTQILGMFGKDFQGGELILLILVLGQLMNVASGSVGQLLVMTGNGKLLRNVIFGSTLLNIALTITLVQRWGPAGAAVASALASVYTKVATSYYVKTRLGFSVNIFAAPHSSGGAARPRQQLGRTMVRTIDKLWTRWHTLAARLKFWPYLSVGPRCLIHRGVLVRALQLKNEALELILKGNNAIGRYTLIQGSASIVFGKNSYCGQFCVFGANELIEIGRDVMIADAVTIRDTDHVILDVTKPMNRQGMVSAPVHVGDDVWIGHGATILKGVHIGRGAIIAAGAVVSTDVPEFAVVGGVPARILRMRLPGGEMVERQEVDKNE